MILLLPTRVSLFLFLNIITASCFNVLMRNVNRYPSQDFVVRNELEDETLLLEINGHIRAVVSFQKNKMLFPADFL